MQFSVQVKVISVNHHEVPYHDMGVKYPSGTRALLAITPKVDFGEGFSRRLPHGITGLVYVCSVGDTTVAEIEVPDVAPFGGDTPSGRPPALSSHYFEREYEPIEPIDNISVTEAAERLQAVLCNPSL